jgi:hypothetical protein
MANGQFSKGNKLGNRFKPGESGNPKGPAKSWLSISLQEQLPNEADEIIAKLLQRAKKNHNDLGLLWNRAEGAVVKDEDANKPSIQVVIVNRPHASDS